MECALSDQMKPTKDDGPERRVAMEKERIKEQRRRRRAEAYIGFLKRQKHSQDQLMLQTTSIKDMKRQSTTEKGLKLK